MARVNSHVSQPRDQLLILTCIDSLDSQNSSSINRVKTQRIADRRLVLSMLFQQAGRASARWATVQSGVHSNRVALAHLSSARVSVPSNPFAALLSGFLHQSPSPALSEARRTYATGAATATAAAPAQGPRPSAALKKPKKARGGRPKGSAKPKSATKAKPKRAVKAKKPAARKAAKPKKKAAPAKPKRKKKAAPAKPKRKVLTEKQKVVVANKKRAAVLRELRTKALAPPSAGLKMTAWMQLVAETNTGRKGTQAPAAVREAAAKYKSLSPKEHEVRAPLPRRAAENERAGTR